MQNPYGSVVFITGATSGIGRETAFLFAQKGYRVYGVSRRGALPNGAAVPAFDGGGTLTLLAGDVTDEAAMQACVNTVLEQEGRIDILIHAAGIGIAGAAEDCTAGDAARQMEVNYYAALTVQRLVLPGMRARKNGLVIHIGSVGGIFAVPFQTLYSSAKAALAIMTEGLRLELRPYGVKAALIEPGDVKTGFTAARVYTAASEGSPYAACCKKAVSRMERDEQGGMPPSRVADAIYRTAQKKNPPAHCVVGTTYALFVFLRRILPARLVERLLYNMYLG